MRLRAGNGRGRGNPCNQFDWWGGTLQSAGPRAHSEMQPNTAQLVPLTIDCLSDFRRTVRCYVCY